MRKSKRRSAAEGRALVKKYEASGLSQRDFAGRAGITVAALQYWLRKGRSEGEEESEPFRFVEVIGKTQESKSGCGVSMELGQVTLRFDSLPSPEYLSMVAMAFAQE
jgi:transcriptional regulator with XRE-family HTH domain